MKCPCVEGYHLNITDSSYTCLFILIKCREMAQCAIVSVFVVCALIQSGDILGLTFWQILHSINKQSHKESIARVKNRKDSHFFVVLLLL